MIVSLLKFVFRNAAIGVVVAMICAPIAFADDAAIKVDYRRDVEPILAKRCFGCHGVDEQQSGLRLDDRANLLRGGDHGRPTIVPGESEASFLIAVVEGTDADVKMPPEGELLTDAQVQMLRDWIDQGAVMPADARAASEKDALWSLQPIRDVEPPAIDPWIANPIDAFVLARLKEKGLSPSPAGDAQTLARRVHLVMHGVPPTAEQRLAWMESAERPGARAKLVEDVLRSPRYGERWAQHWLDVIRWAETAGFETNAPRANAWPYRDWLIAALNDDKPYDQFLFEQIAGDTVGEDAALGFLTAGPANLPGQVGRDEESMRQARQDELDEVIRTVGQACLGLTIGCARCHSHKFDPITHRDYYAMQAVFAGLKYGERRLRGEENDRWTEQVPAAAQQVDELTGELEATRQSLALREPLDDVMDESFAPIRATAVRMEIAATGNNQPASLYEFEVWSNDGKSAPQNMALATGGARPSASGFALENQSRHPDNLVDGSVDPRQSYPWKADQSGPAWIQVDLPQATMIDRIVWRRGSSMPADFTIAVQSGEEWKSVLASRDRLPRIDDIRKAADVVLTRSDDGTAITTQQTEEVVTLIGKLRSAQSTLARLSRGPQVFSAQFDTPDATWLLRRGDPMQRGDALTADVPEVIGRLKLPMEAPDIDRRVALAQILTSKDNPLTARVIVNRLWQHHFGTGIVATPSDFGHMGSPPSHPELLDWLATELIRSNWSLKHIHRLILMSSTFAQQSGPRVDALKIDAESRLLWRFPPQRLDAEALRDSILLVSGRLNGRMGGPGFDFFNQKGGLSDYVARETFDADGSRRMIYATRIRMQAVDIFGAFDCPDAGQMSPSRNVSITPIQALSLWNSPFVNRQSQFMADDIRTKADESLDEQVDMAVERAVGRQPTDEEREQLTTLAKQHGLSQVCRVLLNSSDFVFLQ